MKIAAAITFALVVTCTSAAYADIVTFGSGPNQFTMEFVAIGNPGNAADTTGNPNPAGAVGYAYNMGKYEVSRDMVTKASNAGGLGITLEDMTHFGGNGASRPATGVSWNEAARFVNWLNTSQGFSPAYKFSTQPGDGGYGANQNISLWVSGDAGFNAANPFRNSQAVFFLPSVDEWYKAAYYDPGTATYFDFPTGSDSDPTPVPSGTAAGTAVYSQTSVDSGPADITLAGGLSLYGTMGQGGNVYEWDETEFDLTNDSGSAARGTRGASWGDSSFALSSLYRGPDNPTNEVYVIGFRVASIPEPSALLYGALVMLLIVFWKWSIKSKWSAMTQLA